MSQETPNLNTFDGPLDLLLDLIHRRALDITTISLATVAEQYLHEVSALGESDLERLAGYLVIASRLLLIKSQALLPKATVEAPEEDVGADLVRQLEEYRRYKEVAVQLRAIEEKHHRVFPRQAAPPLPARLAPGGGSTADLVGAFARALSLAPEVQPTETISPPQFRVADKVRELAAALAERGEVDFTATVRAASCRYEVVAYFLALLELLRRGRAMAWQTGLFGPIKLTWMAPAQIQTGDGEPEEGAEGVDGHVDGGAVASRGEELMELIASGEEYDAESGENGGDA